MSKQVRSEIQPGHGRFVLPHPSFDLRHPSLGARNHAVRFNSFGDFLSLLKKINSISGGSSSRIRRRQVKGRFQEGLRPSALVIWSCSSNSLRLPAIDDRTKAWHSGP